MIANYLKLALRQASRNRTHLLINVFGLVLGMASCLLIMLYVFDELSFDRWIADADRVYRYETRYLNPDGGERISRKSPFRASRDLLAYFPEIEHATRIIDHDGVLGTADAKYFERIWFVDADFQQVFGLTLLQGDATAALEDEASVLLSAAMAQKYFGGEDAVGRTLTLDGQKELRVAGVFRDLPDTSHVDFDFIARYDETDPVYGFGYSESWSAIEGYTYIKLAEGTDAKALNDRLSAFLQSHASEFELPPGRQLATAIVPQLRNVRDIHLAAGGLGNIKVPGSEQTLVTLSVIALLVLLVACINYANLSGLRSLGRVREIFVRKAAGAERLQLALQFLLEPVLVSLLALVLSISVVELLLPAYNNWLGRTLASAYLVNIASLATLVMVAILVGVASGVIPAFTLSSMSTATLKAGKADGGRKLSYLQSLLVTLQFAVAATLVVASLVIFLQQTFLEQRELGFSVQNKLVVRNLMEENVAHKRDLLVNQLNALPAVTGITFSTATPGDTTGAGFSRQVTVPGYRDEALPLYPKAVAANFFDVYGVVFTAGRSFSEALASDAFYWPDSSSSGTALATTVLNAAAVAAIGFSNAEEALGKTIVMDSTELEIIGVVQDFHFQSLRDGLTPNFYIYSPAEYPNMTLAYVDAAGSIQMSAAIKDVWERVLPGMPLQLESVSDNVEAQYAADGRQFLLVAVFSALAIVIACLGLYALASYATQRRTREIGIRKVHGALRRDIMQLFLFQFTKPVLLANLLALPCAAYLMSQYLDAYRYHIELSPGLFVLATILTLGMAWCAVIFHTLSAAAARPVEALRHE